MTSREIRETLYHPQEVDFPEYSLIHARICQVLRGSDGKQRPLETAIEVCDEFMNWAELTKETLVLLRPSRVARSDAAKRAELRLVYPDRQVS